MCTQEPRHRDCEDQGVRRIFVVLVRILDGLLVCRVQMVRFVLEVGIGWIIYRRRCCLGDGWNGDFRLSVERRVPEIVGTRGSASCDSSRTDVLQETTTVQSLGAPSSHSPSKASKTPQYAGLGL
jgi:hypothetical protein